MEYEEGQSYFLLIVSCLTVPTMAPLAMVDGSTRR
jgi:hypothetical protein